jgi:hypothetical protein
VKQVNRSSQSPLARRLALFACLRVARRARVRIVPLGRIRITGDHQQTERDHAIDLGHVREVNLVPVVAHAVIVRIDRGCAERMSGHAQVSERLIVAGDALATQRLLVHFTPCT